MADEKEVIVTNDGGGGAGMIIAIVLLIAVLVGLFLLYQNGVFLGRCAGYQRRHQDRDAQDELARPRLCPGESRGPVLMLRVDSGLRRKTKKNWRGAAASGGAPIPG